MEHPGKEETLCLPGVTVLWTVLEILQLCSQNSDNRARESTTGEEGVIRLLSSLVVEGVNGRTENQANQTGSHSLPTDTNTGVCVRRTTRISVCKPRVWKLQEKHRGSEGMGVQKHSQVVSNELLLTLSC